MKKSTWIILLMALLVLLVLSFLTWKTISGNVVQNPENLKNTCNFIDSPLGSCLEDSSNSTQVYTSIAGKQIKIT